MYLFEQSLVICFSSLSRIIYFNFQLVTLTFQYYYQIDLYLYLFINILEKSVYNGHGNLELGTNDRTSTKILSSKHMLTIMLCTV